MTRDSAARSLRKSAGPIEQVNGQNSGQSAAAQGLVVVPIETLRSIIRDEVAEAIAEHEAASAPPADLVDGAEMCRRLSVSRTTLHRLRVAGMPAIRVGDTYRYRASACVAWLGSRGEQ